MVAALVLRSLIKEGIVVARAFFFIGLQKQKMSNHVRCARICIDNVLHIKGHAWVRDLGHANGKLEKVQKKGISSACHP